MSRKVSNAELDVWAARKLRGWKLNGTRWVVPLATQDGGYDRFISDMDSWHPSASIAQAMWCVAFTDMMLRTLTYHKSPEELKVTNATLLHQDGETLAYDGPPDGAAVARGIMLVLYERLGDDG